jgi:hypothetical protein
MIRLPISGVRAQWRSATGHDDIALADSGAGLAGVLDYVARAVSRPDGAPLDPGALPVGDLDLLVVARRRELRGDTLIAEGRCDQCGAVVDVQFSLAAFANHHRPRASRSAAPVPDEPGWWRLRTHDVTFRLPVAADVLAVGEDDDPRTALLSRCVRGALARRGARAAEHAMATLAPTLRADVAGTCPECSANVLLDVDARELCLTELRFLAATVYDDVNLIASTYRWTQAAILNLPSTRRRRYADMIAGRSVDLLEVTVA